MHAHTRVSCLDKPISAPLFLTEEDYFEHTHTHSWVRARRAALVHTALYGLFYLKHRHVLYALRVFHRLSSYFIHSFWINTNRVDECIGVGTNACLCVTFSWTQPKLFLANLSYRSRARTMKSWLFPTRFKMLHALFALALELSMFLYLYLFYSLSLFLFPIVRCTHSQAGRKSTHTFSLNTLNLNSLLIRRYVTSLTLPSSPSFPFCAHTLASCAHPSLHPLPPCFLPSPFIFTRSSSLSLSFLPFSPFFFPLGTCPFRGTREHSAAPLKLCLIWKLIKSVFLPVFPLLFSSQACLCGWETAVTLSQMNLPYVPCGSSWNTDKLVRVLHFYTSRRPQASGGRRRQTPCSSEWQHLIKLN